MDEAVNMAEGEEHEELFVDLLKELHEHGMHPASLYLKGEGVLFGVFEDPGDHRRRLFAVAKMHGGEFFVARGVDGFEDGKEGKDKVASISLPSEIVAALVCLANKPNPEDPEAEKGTKS